MTQTTDQERAEPIKMQPGDDLHLTMLMAPHGLNFVTGKDREQLLAWGRDVWQASRRAKVVPNGYEHGMQSGNRVILDFDTQANADAWFEQFCDSYDAAAPRKPKFDASKLQKLLERLQFVTDEGPPDEGWKSTALEEGIAELERMLTAAPQQPEANSVELHQIKNAAPVQMPESISKVLEDCRSRAIDYATCPSPYNNTRLETAFQYLEHQVRQLLAAKGVKEKVQVHEPANCWCQACDIATSQYGFRTRMSLCPKCGDKRCPRAQHHGFQCQSEKKD